MRPVKYAALAAAVLTMLLGIVCRLLMPNNILFGFAGVTYLRLTVTMLLFALTFHFLFPEH